MNTPRIAVSVACDEKYIIYASYALRSMMRYFPEFEYFIFSDTMNQSIITDMQSKGILIIYIDLSADFDKPPVACWPNHCFWGLKVPEYSRRNGH